jgi:hypothetical protein
MIRDRVGEVEAECSADPAKGRLISFHAHHQNSTCMVRNNGIGITIKIAFRR